MNSELKSATDSWNRLLDRRAQPPPRVRPARTDSGEDDRDIEITIKEMKENILIGDKLDRKEDNVFRVYCQNLNGMKLDALGGDAAELWLLFVE